MTKNSIIGLVAITVIALGAIGGYAFYQNQNNDNNEKNNKDEITNFQQCQEKQGTLTGEFKQTCTYENKDYTRELTDQEKLTKITTFEECQNNGGTVTEETKCTVYGKTFEKELTQEEKDRQELEEFRNKFTLNVQIYPDEDQQKFEDLLEQGLELELYRRIEDYRIDGKYTNFLIYSGRFEETWGTFIVHIPLDNPNDGVPGVTDQFEFEIFYSFDDHGKIQADLRAGENIETVLKYIPDSEISQEKKEKYKEPIGGYEVPSLWFMD